MATISTNQAVKHLTQEIIARVRDTAVKSSSFFRSFFREEVSTARYLEVRASRGFELIATEVRRGDDPNINRMTIDDQKIYNPRYFSESCFLNEMSFYDHLLDESATVSARQFNEMADRAAVEVHEILLKIERANELATAKALLDGIVPTKEGNITFNRQAASLVDKSGTPWTNNVIDPRTHMAEMARFLRIQGKYLGSNFMLVLGHEAAAALENNTIIKDVLDNRRIDRGSFMTPERIQTGADYLGTISAENYNIDLWSYDQRYDQDSSTMGLSYMDPKKAIMLPPSPDFVYGFAGVPKLMPGLYDRGIGLFSDNGKYFLRENTDLKKSTHEIIVSSSSLPILSNADQVVTFKVIAG